MDRTLFPNTTQFPNVLTDQVMPLVSGNEWKVIHYGVRYALGHRSTDTLTIAQIARGRQAEDGAWIDRGTGLDEKEVKECLAFLCDEVHVFLREDRPRKPHGFRLNPDLSSLNWEALDRRQPPLEAPPPVETPVEAPPPAPRRARRDPIFVESPAADVRLDGSDRPVLDLLREKLTAGEGQTFDHLLSLAQEKAQIGQEDMAVWQLYRLWCTYGFRRLQNAFQSPQPLTSLDDANLSCLVGALAETLEKERFGQITQSFKEQITDMAKDWPQLSDWQEAIGIAVKINKRRLQTVETILKNKTTPAGAETPGDKHDARPTAPAPGRKRPARRQSQWSTDELQAGRDADRGEEWPKPLE